MLTDYQLLLSPPQQTKVRPVLLLLLAAVIQFLRFAHTNITVDS